MSMNFINLDERTRELMVNELEMDISQGFLYISPRLTETGIPEYPLLLKDAILTHDETWLARMIHTRNLLKEYAERRKPKGGVTMVKVPATAAETLAEGEFNRFYCRGVCRRAMDEKIESVIVYRAKAVENPRPESQIKIGTRILANTLLFDLRTSIGVEPALGVPPGPNSGLSVRLP